MSLINDMLRDLSKKQTAGQQVTPAIIHDVHSESWEQESIGNFFQHSRIPLMLVTAVIFILGYALMQFLISQYSANQQTASAISPNEIESVQSGDRHLAIETPENNLSQTVINQPLQKFQSDSQLQPNPVVQKNQENAVIQQTEIYQLIDQASRAMTLDRLTSPENDNAYFYYRKLLELDANNKLAISGMQKITDRYLQMAEKSIQKGDFTKANFFLDKATGVTPDDSRIDQLRKSYLSQDVVVMENQQSKIPPVVESTDIKSTEIKSLAVSDPFEQPIQQTSKMVITPNTEFLDQQAVKHAVELIAQGARLKAVDSLEHHIQLYVAPISEQYLLDIYYQDKNIQAMQTLLNSNLNMAAVDQIYYRARVKVLEGDNQSAIGLLESRLSEAAANENYRALLAGLYQREQLYMQAASAYRNLLQSFNSKPAYWLGLALSLDAQNQAPAAVHAYKKILEFEQIESEVQEYAKTRIMQLSRDH
jgi:MSHA biogenesis protein MshN